MKSYSFNLEFSEESSEDLLEDRAWTLDNNPEVLWQNACQFVEKKYGQQVVSGKYMKVYESLFG